MGPRKRWVLIGHWDWGKWWCRQQASQRAQAADGPPFSAPRSWHSHVGVGGQEPAALPSSPPSSGCCDLASRGLGG